MKRAPGYIQWGEKKRCILASLNIWEIGGEGQIFIYLNFQKEILYVSMEVGDTNRYA